MGVSTLRSEFINLRIWVGLLSFFMVLILIFPSVGQCSPSYNDTAEQKSIQGYQVDTSKNRNYIAPNETYIHTIIQVEYSKILRSNIYHLIYFSKVTFIITSNTTAVIPLVETTVERLALRVNGESVTKPLVTQNEIIVSLTPNVTRNEIEVSYESWGGTRYYYHQTPYGFLVEKFEMELDVYDATDNVTLYGSCLLPMELTVIGNHTYCHWEKDNAVINEGIWLSIPTITHVIYTPPDKDTNDNNNVFIILLIVVLLVVVIGIFVAAVIYRIKARKKTESEDIEKKKPGTHKRQQN